MTRLVVMPFRILRPDPIHRLSGVQPGRCRELRAVRTSFGRHPLDCGCIEVRDRHAGSCGLAKALDVDVVLPGIDAEQRRTGSGYRATRSGAVRHVDARDHVAVADRRDLPAAGRTRKTDRRFALALVVEPGAGPHQSRHAGRCRGVRAVLARQSAAAQCLEMVGGARSLSNDRWIAMRSSRRRGRGWAVATG